MNPILVKSTVLFTLIFVGLGLERKEPTISISHLKSWRLADIAQELPPRDPIQQMIREAHKDRIVEEKEYRAIIEKVDQREKFINYFRIKGFSR